MTQVLEITEANAHRVGVTIGSGIGGLGLIESNHTNLMNGGPRKLSPFCSVYHHQHGGRSSVHQRKDCVGPNIAITTACTSWYTMIGFAARMIAYGDADAMVAGGTEKASTPMGMGGFCRESIVCP